MRLVVALAGSLLGAAPASAQYYEAPRPPVAIGPALSDSAAEIVAAMGLEPIGPAMRSGAFLIQRAIDDFGRLLRVTVDARRSQVVAVEPVAPRGAYAVPGTYAGYQPYGPSAPYGYRGAYATRGPAALEAPGPVIGAREHGALPQPHSASIAPDLPAPPTPSAKPKTRSAAVTPQHPLTPTPRKRPTAAPQQAAGTVEPQAAPQSAAPAAPAPAAPAPQPQIAMPPVTPLE